VVIELWAVEAFVFRLLLLLVLRKQLLCAFLSLIFLCGMVPFCGWCVAYVGDARYVIPVSPVLAEQIMFSLIILRYNRSLFT
jgi:hypothetical protein